MNFRQCGKTDTMFSLLEQTIKQKGAVMQLEFFSAFYDEVKSTVNKKNSAENKLKELKFVLKMYASKLEPAQPKKEEV